MNSRASYLFGTVRDIHETYIAIEKLAFFNTEICKFFEKILW